MSSADLKIELHSAELSPWIILLGVVAHLKAGF